LKAAIAAAEAMLRNGGERPTAAEGVLSDDEFKEIQRRHFGRDHSADGSKSAATSLKSCLEAIDAFQRIMKLPAISLATPDDCAKFEQEALRLPKSWRLSYPRAKWENVKTLSSNTVAKWSTALAAAFERANIDAGNKCVRGVVDSTKLLTTNPWRKFKRIKGVKKVKRHFNNEELLSVLDFLEREWSGVTTAAVAVKTCLWTWNRVAELAKLSWDDCKQCGKESHFRIVGKRNIVKWARLPLGLMEELTAIKTSSPFVFAAYSKQVRLHYLHTGQNGIAAQVNAEYSPEAFVSWFQDRIKQWAIATGRKEVTVHVFRKTSLQSARRGEDVNRIVAKDAKLSEAVMTGHYTSEEDEEMRHASNRSFHRLVLSLSQEVASRYGYRPENNLTDLKERLTAATAVEDWSLVGKLAAELSRTLQAANGQKKPSEAAEEGGVSENI
jgi:integrase